MTKNKTVILLQILFCMIMSASAQETTWEPVDPGGNGWLMFASIHPANGDLYFSSDMNFSLMRSTDQGESWQPIANPVTGTPFYVAGDPKEPEILYMNQQGASQKSSGIWRSEDNGETWEHIYQSEEFGISRGQSGLVDPVNNKILYWTAEDMGVRRSADGGYTWSDISEGLPLSELKQGRHLNELELDYFSPVEKRKIYYPTTSGLYFLEEPAHKWILVKGGIPEANCTDVQVCRSNTIYAAFPEYGVYQSLDGGLNWFKLENGLDGKTSFRVLATRNRPEIVYVATTRDRGIYGSDNKGETFRLLTHRRYNSELNWPINYRQHEAVSAQIMFIDPNDPYTVYLDYNKKTHDGGQTWQHYGTQEIRRDRWKGTGLSLLTDYRVVFDPNRPDLIWMGFSDTGLMLSEDGGETIINLISFHRGEVNQAAYWRDKLVRSSGSCVSMAVDPDLSTTIYASINGKNARNRAAVGGIIIKSVDGGWNWQPVYEKNGLDDGIVRSIIIDPGSPVRNRTVYVASYANGVYKSMDDGLGFKCVTPASLFNGNTRLMWLEMAPSDPKTLYLAVGGSFGIRPITFGPEQFPALKPGMFGGVFKTSDGGNSWEKCNSTREIPSVQDIAIHPFDKNIVYVAAYHEEYLLTGTDKNEMGKGGIYQTLDGGQTWNLIFEAPADDYLGQGEVEGICINPVCPEIIYAAVKCYGIYRTLDGGESWLPIGQASMNRMQRRFHSIDLNPHNPAEIWIAHFGNSFSKGIDHDSQNYMFEKFKNDNLISNPGFEQIDEKSDFASGWNKEEPEPPQGEQAVISLSRDRTFEGERALKFKLTEKYGLMPSKIPAEREQLKLEKLGKIPVTGGGRGKTAITGATNAWVYQKVNPYFTTLMRGRRVEIAMDVFIKERNLPKEWSRGSEAGEIPRDPPQIYLTEVRDYNVHWLVAETSLEDLEPVEKIKADEMINSWYHCRAIGRVTEDADWMRVTITGVGDRSGPMEIYIDNVSLRLIN